MSVGLPVFDGEEYVALAIESALGQSWEDLELIVTDNASSDDTEAICRRFAERDPRVRYHRNSANLGAAPNFNLALSLARGTYFKWMAHDDLLERGYLKACVRVLESDPSVVLCHSEVEFIDPRGRRLGRHGSNPEDAGSTDPVRRFRSLSDLGHWCFDVFGLIRADVLRRTAGIASFIGSDRVLLAELALRGRFHRVPEALFLSREHPGRSIRSMDFRERMEWFDRAYGGRITLPHFRHLWEYLRSVHRVPLGARHRLRCYGVLAKWSRRHWRRLAGDIPWAARRLLGRGRGGARP